MQPRHFDRISTPNATLFRLAVETFLSGVLACLSSAFLIVRRLHTDGKSGLVSICLQSAVSPGDSPILALRKQKFRIGGVRVTLVCRDKFFIVRFFGILRVGYPSSQTLHDGFAFVPVQGYDSSGCYGLHLVFYLVLLFLLKIFCRI